MYFVRKAWNKPKTQIGSFDILQDAKIYAHDAGVGYSVFDDNGKVLYKVSKDDWYRVRSSWDNPNSQIGAFQNLDTAKEFADKTSKIVYDWDGNEIYRSKNANTKPVKRSKVDTSVVRTMSYKAKVLKKIGRYNKGSLIEVTRDYKKNWVFPDGTTILKDKKATYLDLIKQIYDNTCKYMKAVAEAWINERKTASETEWLFWCNKYGQRVYIFKGSKGKWKLHKTFKCGTGNIDYSDGADQGVGFGWKIWDKSKEFQGVRAIQYYNMHYSSPWGNSIHYGIAGKPSTHGCIALARTNAIWCFENLPINTRVIVF